MNSVGAPMLYSTDQRHPRLPSPLGGEGKGEGQELGVRIAGARALRRRQTDAERALWAHLRGRRVGEVKFRRQHPVGPYVVDFCCVERRLIIELDGGQHAESVAADRVRTAFLEKGGYRVLRFWDNEVLAHIDVVLEQIFAEVTLEALPTEQHPLTPTLSPRAGRG